MKSFLLTFWFLSFLGCSMSSPVEKIIRDQQFDQYKTALDELESDYLQKKITYAEYLEKKKMVEEEYQGTVDDRMGLIQNHNQPQAAIEMAP